MRVFKKTIPSEIVKKSVEIVAPFAADLNKRAFIFCESKSTLAFERAFCEKCGGSFSVTITSFSRYASFGGTKGKYLDKPSATLVVADVIFKNADKLFRLKKNTFSCALNVFELISQLKSAKVTPEDLSKIAETGNKAFSYKLKDIILIYSEYEKYLGDAGAFDECDVMRIVAERIAEDKDLRGAKVVVAGISNFTARTIDIVAALDGIADLDCVVLSYDGDSALNESLYKLIARFPRAEVFDDDESYSKEVLTLKERLFAEEKTRETGEYSDKIVVAQAADPYEEARFVAAVIKKEIVENGRKFKDFSVACPNVSAYAQALGNALSDQDIAYYADQKTALAAHPIVSAFSAIIDLKRFRLRAEDAVKLTDNALVFYKEERDAIKDHLSENAVPRSIFKKKFGSEAAEAVRQKLIYVYSKTADNATIAQHIENLKEVFSFLEYDIKAKKIVDGLSSAGEDAAASFFAQGIDAFFGILKKTEDILGFKTVSLKEFSDLLVSSLGAREISVLPQYNDGVYIGDHKSVGNYLTKVLFCVGMTDDIPLTKSDVALLNDRELNTLEGFRLVVEPKIAIVNKRERENVATTLMSFSEKLFVTFPLVGTSGKKAEKSCVIDQILAAFSSEDRSPFIVIDEYYYETNEPLARFRSVGSGVKEVMEQAQRFASSLKKELSLAAAFLSVLKEKDERLYLSTVNACRDKTDILNENLKYGGDISPSFIEQYFACPYSAFLKKVLRLKETDEPQVRSSEIGNFFHKAMETFCSFGVISEENVDDCARAAVESAYSNMEREKFEDDPENGFLLETLGEETKKHCKKVFEDMSRSLFKVFGTEIPIEDGGKIPPIELELMGRKIKLKGKIDRADICDADGKNFARIIDYKSGNSVSDKVSPAALYYGNNVQIYLYLKALGKKGYKPVALHYCALADEYRSKDEKNKIYYGYMLKDEEVLHAIDKNYPTGRMSEEYGKDIKKSRSLLTEDELNDLTEYAEKVSLSCAEDAAKGLFCASPTGLACAYCKFKGSCRFDCDNLALYREQSSVKVEDISRALGRAVDDDGEQVKENE